MSLTALVFGWAALLVIGCAVFCLIGYKIGKLAELRQALASAEQPSYHPSGDLVSQGVVELAKAQPGDPRATHRVHRCAESLPCYCSATSDHPIGQEQPSEEIERIAAHMDSGLRLTGDDYKAASMAVKQPSEGDVGLDIEKRRQDYFWQTDMSGLNPQQAMHKVFRDAFALGATTPPQTEGDVGRDVHCATVERIHALGPRLGVAMPESMEYMACCFEVELNRVLNGVDRLLDELSDMEGDSHAVSMAKFGIGMFCLTWANKMRELLDVIEKIPPSPEQTTASLLCSDMGRELLDKRDELLPEATTPPQEPVACAIRGCRPDPRCGEEECVNCERTVCTDHVAEYSSEDGDDPICVECKNPIDALMGIIENANAHDARVVEAARGRIRALTNYGQTAANDEAAKCACGQPAEFCGHCVTAVVRPNDEAKAYPMSRQQVDARFGAFTTNDEAVRRAVWILDRWLRIDEPRSDDHTHEKARQRLTDDTRAFLTPYKQEGK